MYVSVRKEKYECGKPAYWTWLEVGHCWQVTIDEELSCIRMIATCLNVYAAQIDKTLLVFKLIYIADTVLNILVYKIYHKYIRI